MPRWQVFSALALASHVLGHPADGFIGKGMGDACPVNFGTIGDSWASGVTYGVFGQTNYDDNKSGCMRINHAYGVQLQKGLSKNFGKGKFTFAACSGARLIDMAKGANQMSQIPEETDFLTMQAGGNNAGFYAIARDCMYHVEPKEYGDAYPNPGECLNSINAAERYIQAPHDSLGLWLDMQATINDILGNPAAKNEAFKLYVLGYAHLFSVDSPGSDWCNDASFSVAPSEYLRNKQVKLSNAMRSKVNDLTTQLNSQIEGVVRGLNNPKVKYVSITEKFDGHRFCEKGSNLYQQYFGSDVWFWNTSPEGLFITDGGLDFFKTASSIQKQNKADKAWNEAYNTSHPSQKALDAFDWSDLLLMEKGVHAKSPNQNGSPGFALRPCHPKAEGHGAINDALKAEIDKDFSGGGINCKH